MDSVKQIYYKEQYWNLISKSVAEILNPNNDTKIYFEQVYTLVYKCVSEGFLEYLRMDLMDCCCNHMKYVNVELDSRVNAFEGSKKVIETVCLLNKALEAFLSSVQQICAIFGYLNKVQQAESSDMSLENSLLSNFCQIVCDHRLESMMALIESCPPFTFHPADMSNFFCNLHKVSSGHYATVYPKLFSRYIARILPQMSEQDLDGYIQEVSRLQLGLRATMESRSSHTGVKRPAED